MQVLGLHSESTVENVYDMIIMNRAKRYASGDAVLFGKRKKSASGQSAAGKISDPRPNRVDCCRSSPNQGCPLSLFLIFKISLRGLRAVWSTPLFALRLCCQIYTVPQRQVYCLCSLVNAIVIARSGLRRSKQIGSSDPALCSKASRPYIRFGLE